MALGGVVPLVWSAREWIARGGAPEEPLFGGPQVRAKVDEARLRGRAGDRVDGATGRPGEVPHRRRPLPAPSRAAAEAPQHPQTRLESAVSRNGGLGWLVLTVLGSAVGVIAGHALATGVL